MVVFPCVKKPTAFCILFSVSASREDVASSSNMIGLFLIIALAIEILCFSPPDNLIPFSPIIVSYLFGSLSINSSAKENFAASSISSNEAFGLA